MSDAYADAASELAKAVALGLVPGFAQAVDVYDTLESIYRLNASEKPDEVREAKFDLVLALIGWVPGIGDGVKKSLRLVNKNPERFAPVLFDLLRHACLLAGIRTSPEAVLDEIFNAGYLKGQLGTIKTGVHDTWLYKELTQETQASVNRTLDQLASTLPSMLGIVASKLTHWKRLQRNNAAWTQGKSRHGPAKVAKRDNEVAARGADAPNHGSAYSVVTAQVGTLSVETLANNAIGSVGEHLTDYFLYHDYGWGQGWQSHDLGARGTWSATPDHNKLGKLNEDGLLKKLFAVNVKGTGIDGVWRASSHNEGKPYAIVESKASKIAKQLKDPSRKPGIRGKLGVSGINRVKDTVRPKAEELLEDLASEAETGAGKPNKKRHGKAMQRQQGGQRRQPVVQMSHAWIEANIKREVDPEIWEEIRVKGKDLYSRHLFYTPFYLPSALEHEQALLAGNAEDHDRHKDHSIPPTHRYDDAEIEKAVQAKAKALKVKNAP